MTAVYINQIETAVPPYDVHTRFTDLALRFLGGGRGEALFRRLVDKAQIEHRYSFFGGEGETSVDETGFYQENSFPDTAARMRFYKAHAFRLIEIALDKLRLRSHQSTVTHLIITSCTGFYAPGLDLEIVKHYGLSPHVERTNVGFMGCSAAFNALKLAWDIVRSRPQSQVLVVNLELCTAHLQATPDLEKLLSFLIFADGGAASLVSSEPGGLRMDHFMSSVIPDSSDLIMWDVGASGFDMVLSGKIPGAISDSLSKLGATLFSTGTQDVVDYWAVHPGGRTVLDAVQRGLGLTEEALGYSRRVLRDFGNMSSATVMFVLRAILEENGAAGYGRALAFGPGVTVESMSFFKSGR